MKSIRSLLCLAVCFVLPAGALAQGAPAPASAAPAAGGDEAPANPVEKPIRTLINAVRFGKYDMALKFLAGDPMGEALLGPDWAKGTPEQRAEFVKLFHQLFAKIAFPKMKDKFEHLQTIVYDKPEIAGTTAHVKSTIVILHAVKKQELKLHYTLIQDGADWKVKDVEVLGDSMLKGIREDQIIPIMQEGGWDNLLKLMREKAAG